MGHRVNTYDDPARDCPPPEQAVFVPSIMLLQKLSPSSFVLKLDFAAIAERHARPTACSQTVISLVLSWKRHLISHVDVSLRWLCLHSPEPRESAIDFAAAVARGQSTATGVEVTCDVVVVVVSSTAASVVNPANERPSSSTACDGGITAAVNRQTNGLKSAWSAHS